MTLQSFLQFSRRYQLCPSLFSSLEATQIFRSCSPCLGVAQQQHFPDAVTYRGFLSCLARSALVLFSGVEWDLHYPSSEQKLRLLLFWMDQSSTLFKGNSGSLTQQLKTCPATRTVEKSLPRFEALDRELMIIFARFCGIGDQQAVNQSPAMSAARFIRCIRTMGMIGGGLSAGHVDLIFVANAAATSQADKAAVQEWSTNFNQNQHSKGSSMRCSKMDYLSFYSALAEIGMKKYPTAGSPGASLHRLLIQEFIPFAIHQVEESCNQQCTLHHAPVPVFIMCLKILFSSSVRLCS